jgi:ribonuclease HI
LKVVKSIYALFTDGACLFNPGQGGYGGILITGRERKEFSGGFRLTTNNRMELMAVITGLEMLLSPCIVHVFSDSKYVVDAINLGWVENWQERGWKRNTRGKVENVDLWKRLLIQLARHKVDFVWVRGHTGNPYNERCDRLSNQAAKGKELPVDVGYEVGQKQLDSSLFDLDQF